MSALIVIQKYFQCSTRYCTIVICKYWTANVLFFTSPVWYFRWFYEQENWSSTSSCHDFMFGTIYNYIIISMFLRYWFFNKCAPVYKNSNNNDLEEAWFLIYSYSFIFIFIILFRKLEKSMHEFHIISYLSFYTYFLLHHQLTMKRKS